MEDQKQESGTEIAVKIQNEEKENKVTLDEETSLDEEFIKIDREVLSMKDHIVLETMSGDQPSFTTNMDHVESIPVSEWIEAQEMIKELRIQLDIVSEKLSASESEKSKLKIQVEHANEKLKERESHCHVVELDLKKLKEEASNAELEHSSQLRLLKEDLDAQEIKYQELLDVKEAFDMLSLELDSSMMRTKKLENDLLSSVEECRKCEELSREKIKYAEQESMKASEFEKKLEVAKNSAKEMEEQMFSMKEELKNLKNLIAENQHIKDAPSRTMPELSSVQEDPGISKSRELVLEGKPNFDAVTENKNIELNKVSEELDTNKALEYEKMLEVAKLNSDEMEKKVVHLEKEMRDLYDKIAEHQQVEDAHKSTVIELSLVKEELSLMKNEVDELKQKLTSERGMVEELERVLSMCKDSEEQAKNELLELQAQFADFKVEYHAKIAVLQDVEIKYNQELKAREVIEISSRDLEKHIDDLQDQLHKFSNEKATSVQNDDSLQEFKDACNALEEKLALTEKKFKEADSLLSQSLAEKLELEEKLSSLEILHHKALSDTMAELTLIRGELDVSKNQIMEWELKSVAEGAMIEELKREVSFYKDSEEQAKAELLETHAHLSDLKEDQHKKVTYFEEVEAKYIEESKAREAVEVSFKSLEKEMVNLQEHLVNICKEKESLEAVLVERDYNLQQRQSACNILEEKLDIYELKLKETDSLLSQALSANHDLEEKIALLEEIRKESATLAKSATQRNFELQDLIRSSNAAESEVKMQMKEVESKLESLQQKNVQLEKLLNAAESKCSDREYEVEQLHKKISEIEYKLGSNEESHNKELSDAMGELTLVKEELNASRNEVMELQQKLISEGTTVEELRREVCLYKDCEEQAKKEISELLTQLSDMKEEHHIKINSLQDVERNLIEECKAREAIQNNFKDLEKESITFQKQLSEIGKEKESLETILVERNNYLQQTEEACSILQEKLNLSEEKLKGMESMLLQSRSENLELERKLGSLEELNKESDAIAMSATQRNLELQDLIRSSNTAESEAKAQVKEAASRLESLQQRHVELEEQLKLAELKCSDKEYEVEQLQDNISELQKRVSYLEDSHEKARKDTAAELNLVKEELLVARNQVMEWQHKSSSQEAIIDEHKREISLYKDSEEQANKELQELQTLLSDMKEELHAKVTSLQDVEIKYFEESKAREDVEISLKGLESKIVNFQEQLLEVGKEKESLETILVERSNNLQQTREACSVLQEKLDISVVRLQEMESLLAQSSSEKHDLEQKMGLLEEAGKESASLARSATQRNFELQDLIRSSNEAESEVKAQMEEAETKLESLQQQNGELEKQLNVAELKCSNKEYEVELLHKQIAELEQKLSELEESNGKVIQKQISELEDTMAELSLVKEELLVSKNQVMEWEQKSISAGAMIVGLKREISLYKDSEEQVKKELQELQTQLSDLKDELHVKRTRLQDVELKYDEEFKARESIQINFTSLEKGFFHLQEQLVGSGKEKESLEALLIELENGLQQTKEDGDVLEEKLKQSTDACKVLENKLGLSEEKLKETDLLLSQTLSEKNELEQRLCSLEGLYKESDALANTISQRNLVLEELIHSSNAAELEVKAQMGERESKLADLQLKSRELEELLSLAESKCTEREYEVEQLHGKISELTKLIKDFEEERELSRCHMQAYEDSVRQLEFSLSMSTKKGTELEQQLNDLNEKCAYHENEASTSKQRGFELEDLIQVAHSKSKDADSKVTELVLQLESTMQQLQELEEKQRIREAKYKDTEVEVKQLRGSVTELSSELEAFSVRSSSLEIALQDAVQKEKELTSLLNVVTEEKKTLEIALQSKSEKLSETMNALALLENDLKLAHENLHCIENNLEDSKIREKRIAEELRSTGVQLDCQIKVAEQAATRISELELQLESHLKESESKHQEALADISEKTFQIEDLSKTLASTRDEVTLYQGQVDEAAQKITVLEEKVKEDYIAHTSLESVISDLKEKVEDAELKVEQSLAENEVMAVTNHQLKDEIGRQQSKIDQLQELFNSVNTEKEATADQLACHIKSIAELSEQHSRGLELHAATESYARQTEAELKETIQMLRVRDSEARDLNEKLLAIENEAKFHEERAIEVGYVAETTKSELEENLAKLKSLEEEFQKKINQFEMEKEVLSTINLKQTRELETLTAELRELHTRLDEFRLEKESAIDLLHSSRITIDDLNKQLASEGERFQSQLSPIIEENNSLKELHQGTKKELDSVIIGLEERLSEKKANEELLMDQLASLNAELLVKSEMQAKIDLLEQKLILVETQHKDEMAIIRGEKEELWSRLEDAASKLKEKEGLDEEAVQLRKELHFAQTTISKQRELDVRKELEREVSLKKANEDFLDERQEKLVLEKYILEIEQKLLAVESKMEEKEIEGEKRVAALISEFRNMETKAAEFEKKAIDLEKELRAANVTATMQDERDVREVSSSSELSDAEYTIAELRRTVKDLQSDLQTANAKIAKQDENDKMHAASTSEVSFAESRVADLEKMVVELQNDLRTANAKIAKQEVQITEARSKVQVEETTSRDFVLEPTTVSKRKSKKRTEGPSEVTLAHPAAAAMEPTLWESLKFVMGIAFFSVIVGIILGKRY